MIEHVNGYPDRPAPTRPQRGLGAILDAFGSLWTGIILATALFIYCSMGSAFPQLRQMPALEMTEFEWFHWWPFNLLVLTFCLSMATATIRRIPLRVVNIGVWAVHAGIITLAIGSYYYFGTKIEGDTPVFRRRVTINLPGMSEPRHLPALPGNQAAFNSSDGEWKFAVQDTNTDWPILTEEHKGKSAYAVNVMVSPPNGEAFIRQLLDGYPQYTEDVIPGKGRAVKSLGRKLVNEALELKLGYEPQEYFHLMDTWALYVRKAGSDEWTGRAIDGLPRYNNRVASREHVFHEAWDPLRIDPIDLLVPTSVGDALDRATVRVTGYLRYARYEQRWREGGGRVNPLLRITAETATSRGQSYELLALDPQRRQAGAGVVQFVWVSSAAQIAEIPRESRALLHIEAPGTSTSLNIPITPENLKGPAQPIEGTQFSYRLLDLHDNLSLPGSERPISIAVVEIQSPTGTFRRWVADKPERTRDLHGEGDDPHNLDTRMPDPRLVTEYRPAVSPILFVAHPEGLRFLFNPPSGGGIDREVRVGERVEVAPGLGIRVDGFMRNAVAESAPYIVPASAQQPKAGSTFSMIRLEVESGGQRQTEWIPFSPYSFSSEQYAGAGRFTYAPVKFQTADGGGAEVLFSRKRLKLPYPVALEKFELDTHVGGYTGSASTIRNYLSQLRFFENNQWTNPKAIAVNQPTEFGDLWYFQSTWDPPQRNAPGSGMNYTGLGVGNRYGVHIQLLGCCVAVAGMFFAFYVKPVIRRRQRIAQARQNSGEYVEAESAGAKESEEVSV